MPNSPMDTSLFDRAAKFAVDAHANTQRRGKGFPYVIHVMEAAEIVASITNDQELLAAAILHDVVEDTDATVEDVRREFGDRVASLVAADSDPVYDNLSETESWKMRKQHIIDRLAQSNRDAKIVAMGDKLSNMRAIARDFNRKGDELWKIFHAPDPRLHEWHYRELEKVLSELSDTDAFIEFSFLIHETFSRAFKEKGEEK